MDMLVEIPREKWIHLRDLYKTVWPEGMVAYCVVDIHLSNPTISDIINLKVYCPEGDLNNGMVAITDLFGYYEVLIHPLNDIAKIEESLQYTNIINWSRGVHVPSANLEVIECLKRLQNRLKINIKYDTKAYKHFLCDDTPQFDVSVCPPDSYVAPLKPEYVSLVDKTWTYHNEITYQLFEILMSHDLTYVLYSSKDDTPMSWITVNVQGALTHLYTLEPYRRLGYGEYITKYAANDLRRKGKMVLAYTVEDNKKPQQMFEKLGFRIIGIDQWLYVE